MNHTVLKFLNTTLILAQLLMNTERVTFYESYCTEVLKYHFDPCAAAYEYREGHLL